MNRPHQVSDASVPNAAWKALFLAGAIAALVAVLFFRRNCGAELTLFNGIGLFNVPETPPTTAIDWFMLLQNDRFVGLALLDLFDLANYALVGLIFLALYSALRHVHKSAMVVATSFGLVGIAVYFASNQAFSMLSLSDRYAAATTDMQKAMFLAAGEALLAIHNPGALHQGTGIYLSLLLVLLAGLIISLVMLRSTVFSRATAFASDGAPSDCVALALLGFIPKKIDLVVFGINPHANMGHDVTYSGTVTAAMEAVISGVPGIAFSLAGDDLTEYRRTMQLRTWSWEDETESEPSSVPVNLLPEVQKV